jgi:NAD(P)-dependent dehydrogenase (short-subunit alcohol dehydrogenase family)
MQDLEGKVAFVTGGASGIGLGITKRLVDAGMKVVIADLRQDHIDEAMEWFAERQLSRNVHAIRLDVTDRAAMAAAADETEKVFGKVHVAVNNAGVGIEGPLKEATYEDWDFGLAVNLGGVINGVQTFAPRIRKHGEGGHIVNTASLAGLVVMPSQMAMYVTAKAGVVALSEAIRAELAQDNIGVSVLCPGPIKSNIHQLSQNRPEKFKASGAFAAAADRLGQRHVSDLWMEPEQVGDMVVKAIRNDELYIITHGEWREAVKARYDAMLQAMPTEVNPELIASMRPPPKKD